MLISAGLASDDCYTATIRSPAASDCRYHSLGSHEAMIDCFGAPCLANEKARQDRHEAHVARP